LAAEIRKARGIESRLIKGSGGQFEVVLDGRLIFSKKKEQRFPETTEILEMIPAA
jgi:selT/selW/selH-like putative selenoprotein